MFNTNDPVVRLVLAVVAVGVGILLITLIPYGIVAFIALLVVIYYLLKRSNKL